MEKMMLQFFLPQKMRDTEATRFAFLAALTFAAVLTYIAFLMFPFELTRTYDQAISLPMLFGVDAPRRQTAYFTLLLLFPIAFSSGYFLIQRIFTQMEKRGGLGRYKVLLGICVISCLCCLATISFRLSHEPPRLRFYPYIVFAVLVLVTLTSTFHIQISSSPFIHSLKRAISPCIASKDWQFLGWMSVFLVYCLIRGFVFKDNGANYLYRLILGLLSGEALGLIAQAMNKKKTIGLFSERQVGIFLLLSALLFFVTCIYEAPAGILFLSVPGTPSRLSIAAVAILWLLSSKIDDAFCKSTRLLSVGAPMLLLPAFYTFSAEIQYFLTKYAIISTKAIYSTLFGLLVIACAFIYLLNYRLKLSNLLRYWYYPALIIAWGFNLYWSSDVSVQGTLDLLHPANSLVPFQQFTNFGVLPYVEYWPAQGLGWGGIGGIYNWLYNWPAVGNIGFSTALQNNSMVYIPLFVIFSYVFPFSLAFLLIFFLPYSDLSYYGFIVISAASTILVRSKFTLLRTSIIWMVSVLCFVFMPAAGKGATLGILLFLIIKSIGDRKKLIISIASFVFTYGVAVAIYFSLVMLRGHDVHDTWQLIKSCALAEFSIGSYLSILNELSYLSFVYYVIFPLVALSVCCYCAYKRLCNLSLNVAHQFALVLASMILFLHIRALARHCLIESYSFTFLIPLLFLCPALSCFKAARNKISIQVYIFALILLLYICYPIHYLTSPFFQIKSGEWTTPRPERVRVVMSESTAEIVTFLRENLTQDETFIELISGHYLYALADKKFPLFHHATHLLQTATPQQIYIRQIENLYERGELPLLIHSTTIFWGGSIDGIPSAQALFLLSEYLYTRYVPYRTIGGFQVWAAKNSRFVVDDPYLKESDDILVEQYFHWQDIPRLWAKYGNITIPKRSTVSRPLLDGYSTFKYQELDFAEDGRYLVLRIKSQSDGEMTGVLSSEMRQDEDYTQEGTFSFTYQATDIPIDYIIPIKALYAEQSILKKRLTLLPSTPVEVMTNAIPTENYRANPFLEVKESSLSFAQETYKGHMDTINSVPAPQVSTLKKNQPITCIGWLAASIEPPSLPAKVYITLTDAQGNMIIYKAKYNLNRPDVAAAYNKDKLELSGFSGTFHPGNLKGEYQLGIAIEKDGQIEKCLDPNLQFSVVLGAP